MNLSVIILTHNEQEMLPGCLESVKWADEIVVIDKGSTDKTVEIAKKAGVKVIAFEGFHFDEWRNLGLSNVANDWIFYIDPDERVDSELRKEIERVIAANEKVSTPSRHPRTGALAANIGDPGISSSQDIDQLQALHGSPMSTDGRLEDDVEGPSAYKLPRKNFWWGQEFKACGAWPDYVTRLFKKEKLKKWHGIIHESPIIEGSIGILENPLLHYTHRDLVSGLKKSYQWTRMEAELFHQAGHPPITWWRLGKVTLESFLKKYIGQKGYTEGTTGFIESAVQAWNRFMVYEQLWEMQQSPSLDKWYEKRVTTRAKDK